MSRFAKGGAAAAMIAAVLIGYEGIRYKAYIPIPGDVPTICVGETAGVKMGDTATHQECLDMLMKSVAKHERGMLQCLDRPERIPDKSYVAFVSFGYNVGVGAFCKSTMRSLINQGRIREACDQLLKWDRAGGRVVRGLTIRRQAERKLCLEGLA